MTSNETKRQGPNGTWTIDFAGEQFYGAPCASMARNLDGTFTVTLCTAERDMQNNWRTAFAESTPARPYKTEAGARRKIAEWMARRLYA